MKKALWWGMSIGLAQSVALCAALCAALVLLGCPDDKDPGTDPEFEGNILKVTGIPLDVTIFASFLMDDLDLQTPAPDVTGINMQEETTGIFNLYEASPNFFPDLTKPWTGSGAYYVGLAVSIKPDDPQYIYTDGKEALVLDTEELKQNLEAAFKDDPATEQTLITFIYSVMPAIQQGYDQLDLAAILADPDNEDAIEILAGVAQKSVTINIKKYDIKDTPTEIAFSKFKLLSQEKIFDDLIAFFKSPEGMFFLMGLLLPK
jgi:hypothetical protein